MKRRDHHDQKTDFIEKEEKLWRTHINSWKEGVLGSAAYRHEPDRPDRSPDLRLCGEGYRRPHRGRPAQPARPFRFLIKAPNSAADFSKPATGSIACAIEECRAPVRVAST